MRIEATLEHPWRTEPKFGGMTDANAEKSWRAEQEATNPLVTWRDPPAPKFRLTPFNEIEIDRTRRNYLVKGLLSSTGIVVIWGPPKCGKSFLALWIALHIALNWPYRGRRVQGGPVVYLALEGAEGFKARIEAFRQRYGVQDAPFFLITVALNLVKERGALIADIKRQLGDIKPVAVFLDTLNRSLVGSESKDEDMAQYIAAAEELASAFSCVVPIVHHCGIDASRPRGHTSLSGAVEVQLAVKREGEGQFSVTVELAKDGPEGDRLLSHLEQVEVGTDPDGDPITTCVVVEDAVEAMAPRARVKLKGAPAVAFDLLRKAIDEAGEIPPHSEHIPPNIRTIPVETWRRYAYLGSISESDKADTRRRVFVRAVEKLQAAKLVGVWGDYAWIAQ